MSTHFADEVRDELAHVALPKACCAMAELSGALRVAATFERRGGREAFDLVLDTASGPVARRVLSDAATVEGVDTEIEVHQPSGLHRTVRYHVRLSAPPAVLHRLGLVDGDGVPQATAGAALPSRACDRAAYVRGAFMAAGSVSAPSRAPHLEIRAHGEAAARELGGIVREVAGGKAAAGSHGDGWRVTVKSGAAIGVLLTRVGAHGAFLRWDEGRFRRELRGDANRAANADRANVGRAVEAAGRQVSALSRLLVSPQWATLDEELRAAALARLANPEASLAELGGLLDPPAGKATVHRRLARLLALVEAESA